MKKLLVGAAVVAVLGVGAAQAADMPVYKAPRPVIEPIYTWTGLYIGINAGGSIGRNSSSDRGVYTAPGLPTPVLLYNESSYHSPAGAIAGGQIGYNWQGSGPFVIGGEIDWQWSRQRDSACVFSCGATTAAFFGPGGAGFNNFLYDEQKLTWLATARARAGLAYKGWLWYVTGGAALGTPGA